MESMKIVHIDLTGPFTVGMNYQENILPEINASDGNEVYLIASQYKWEKDRMIKTEQVQEMTEAGVRIIRFPFIKLGIPLLTERLRIVKGMYRILDELCPNVIMLHGFQTMSVIAVTKYMKKNAECKLFVDTHSDWINSAPNFVSKYVLHRGFYALMSKAVLKYTSKIWCISYDVMAFSHEAYDISYDRLEWYPLGGTIFTEEEYLKRRYDIRVKHSIAEDDILMVHSGKMSHSKKTDELLELMKMVKNPKIKMILVGEMDAEIKIIYKNCAGDDERIIFTGWKTGEELLSYLCAADIYVQPGTQSATMQNAACCKCALLLYPYESHLRLFGDSVFYVEGIEDMIKIMAEMEDNPTMMGQYRDKSFAIAKEKLDYKKLAGKLYE